MYYIGNSPIEASEVSAAVIEAPAAPVISEPVAAPPQEPTISVNLPESVSTGEPAPVDYSTKGEKWSGSKGHKNHHRRKHRHSRQDNIPSYPYVSPDPYYPLVPYYSPPPSSSQTPIYVINNRPETSGKINWMVISAVLALLILLK